MTLLEVMIVIFLITLITGVVGYNLKGSMDKGRKFKTEQGKQQLHDLLMLCLNEEVKGELPTATDVAERPEYYLEALGLAKDPKKIVLDGWGSRYKIKAIKNGTDFEITSDHK